ncbi:zinc finger protein 85-like isoform X2 [Folsomia candida]|uniref:Protein odd-skipped n=1 Tax=Folsomia candida TaxID=158441 RepID=A0A226DW82_FOLCA|nr:zinc finger protein 85-like isoform X2 [Folsomia candida]OXA48456.1 Protein odd-skipped [Folsomia candida]
MGQDFFPKHYFYGVIISILVITQATCYKIFNGHENLDISDGEGAIYDCVRLCAYLLVAILTVLLYLAVCAYQVCTVGLEDGGWLGKEESNSSIKRSKATQLHDKVQNNANSLSTFKISKSGKTDFENRKCQITLRIRFREGAPTTAEVLDEGLGLIGEQFGDSSSAESVDSDNSSQAATDQVFYPPEKPTNRTEPFMKSSRPREQFACIFCNRRFTNGYNLSIHEETHTNEKPFSCDICGEMFRRKEELRGHRYVHRKDKPFKCTGCGKSFSHSRTLAVHKVIHRQESQTTPTVPQTMFPY